MKIKPKELIDEINLLRTNPKAFAEKVKKYISFFENDKLVIPEAKIKLRTDEGAKAFEEAVEFLNGLKPLEGIVASKGMTNIAKDFFEKIKITHPGLLGDIKIDEIIAKYGEFTGSFRRAMEFGGYNSEHVVVNLVVCDGDKSRSQRNILLSPGLKMFGVATGGHPNPKYRTATVIIGCDNFKNLKDADDTENFENNNK